MRTVVVVILLLAPLVFGQAQSDAENGIVEFYTTPSARPTAGPGSFVIFSGDQKLGEVTLNEFVRFSGAPGTYSFQLTPNSPVREQISVSLRPGQHLYIPVSSEGFFLGSAAEAVRPQPVRAPVATTPASKKSATIFFYRDRLGPNQQVTIYSLFVAGSQPIAALQKGEYVAMSVPPGMTAFSWVPAPARGQTVMMDIGPGQQIFLKVQPSGITAIPNDNRLSLDGLQTVARTRIFDTARVVNQVVTPPQAVAEVANNQSRTNVQLSPNNRPSAEDQAARQRQSESPNPANTRPLVDAASPQTVRQVATQQRPADPTNRQEIK